ncbi:HEPN domain-containing protein [Methylorubrum aminovorans]|uniref:HEPN domain-containing protein n=1 Tax=Methylorubrum aminovorans TaxID=269069 RepID=UPI003C30BA07
MAKAERALKAARLLSEVGDTEGACSRAYYAMFDAARASLKATGHLSEEMNIKTHAGVIAAFGRELVLTGQVDAAFGRAFNRLQDIRVRADYMAGAPSTEEAEWALTQAEAFVMAMRARLFPD